MKIDFDNYRKQTVNQYNNLTESFKNIEFEDITREDFEFIKKQVKDLRTYIVTLTALVDFDGEFKSLDIPVNVLK